MEKEKEVILLEEQKQSGLTFPNYIQGIKKAKWWIVASSLVCVVLGYSAFKFIINPSKKTLQITYTCNLAGTYEDEDTIRFVDGSVFNSYDLTTELNLCKVKYSKDEYARVDVDKIVTSNGITITKNVAEKTDTTNTTNGKVTNVNVTHTLVAKTSLFPSEKIGKQFIFDLVSLPKQLSNNAINNYNVDSYLSTNFSSLSFEKQVEQLGKQYHTIHNVYADLADKFGGSAVTDSDGIRLNEALNDFEASYYSNGSQLFYKDLEASLFANRYVDYEEGKEAEKAAELRENCASYIESVKKENYQISVYEDILAAWTSPTTYIQTDTDFPKQIVELSDKISELKTYVFNLVQELNKNGFYYPDNDLSKECAYDGTDHDSAIYKLEHTADPSFESWAEGCKKFKDSVKKYYDLLEEDSETTTGVVRYCYDVYQNRVNVLDGGYVVAKGGITSLVGIVGGLVIGFLASSLIAGAVVTYQNNNKKKEEK